MNIRNDRSANFLAAEPKPAQLTNQFGMGVRVTEHTTSWQALVGSFLRLRDIFSITLRISKCWARPSA